MNNRLLSIVVIIVSLFGLSSASGVYASNPAWMCSISGNIVITGTVVTGQSGCMGIATIPTNVTAIADFAFRNANMMTVITIPASVTIIGRGAFVGASKLTDFTVAIANTSYASSSGVLYNKTLTQIIAYPLGKVSTTFTIPASVTTIADMAFSGATLSTVKFGAKSNLTTIGNYAFDRAGALTSITIPASVTSIGSYAFREARALNSVSFEVGSRLTNIGADAFKRTVLTAITIPASVTTIGNYAFYEAGALKRVYFLGNKPAIGTGTFAGVSANAYIWSTATGYPAVGANMAGLTVVVGVYNLTYDTGGGSDIASGVWLLDVAIPAPTHPKRAGYTFVGWAATSGGETLTFPYAPPTGADVTLYAIWKAPTPILTVTRTRTSTSTATKSPTPTRTSTSTATKSPTRTSTSTATKSPTQTSASTAMNTRTRTSTSTATKTQTPTRVPTTTRTVTPTVPEIVFSGGWFNTAWTVSVNGVYAGLDPTLSLKVGSQYRFRVGVHQLSIRNPDLSIYAGVSGFPLSAGQSTVFQLPSTAPATLRYVCNVYAAMSGQITVVR